MFLAKFAMGRDTTETLWMSTLKVRNIADILNIPCEEALGFFENQPAIVRHMQTLVDVGLGYVRLGTTAPTLSGGEAQRGTRERARQTIDRAYNVHS